MPPIQQTHLDDIADDTAGLLAAALKSVGWTYTPRCPRCEGCGKLADSDDREPWTVWENLPLRSAGAVLLGLVKPIECPDCSGTGKVTGP